MEKLERMQRERRRKPLQAGDRPIVFPEVAYAASSTPNQCCWSMPRIAPKKCSKIPTLCSEYDASVSQRKDNLTSFNQNARAWKGLARWQRGRCSGTGSSSYSEELSTKKIRNLKLVLCRAAYYDCAKKCVPGGTPVHTLRRPNKEYCFGVFRRYGRLKTATKKVFPIVFPFAHSQGKYLLL